jgi:hypothetical protein
MAHPTITLARAIEGVACQYGKQKKMKITKIDSGSLTPADFPQLREQWFEKFSDLCGEVPLELPPFQEVNHEINLMDDHKWIN